MRHIHHGTCRQVFGHTFRITNSVLETNAHRKWDSYVCQGQWIKCVTVFLYHARGSDLTSDLLTQIVVSVRGVFWRQKTRCSVRSRVACCSASRR